jgi:hypothetical protein
MEHLFKYNWLNDEIRYLDDEAQINLDDINEGDIVCQDFSNIRFVIPFCLLGMLSSCRRLKEKTGRKVLLQGLSEEVYLHLKRMKLFDIGKEYIDLRGDYSNFKPWAENPQSLNLIEITRIDEDEERGARNVLEVVKTLRERSGEILSLWLQRNVLEIDGFVTVLSEVAQNIFEHSKDFGYIALNRYKHGNKVRLNLSILDGGVGLGHSVRQKLLKQGKKLKVASDYIWYPFYFGLSRSQGGGLLKVFDYLKEWSGSLFVRSGSGCALKESSKITFSALDNLPDFRGSHIGIWLEAKL